jgi:hypothetical protein
MKVGRILAAAIVLAVFQAPVLIAQTANQTVTYSVAAINQISVGAGPTLDITTATPGGAPTSVTATSTWSVTTNGANKKLTASINSAMDAGLTLSLTAAAPSGATSAGSKTLSTSTTDLVTGISGVAASNLTLTYELAATLAAGIVPSSTRTVTFTLVTGP